MSTALRLATALSIMVTLSGCDEDHMILLLQGKVDQNEQDIAALKAQDVEVSSSEAEASSIPPVAAIPDPVSSSSSEECISIFRVQTCEDGVLHHLDANMNWID